MWSSVVRISNKALSKDALPSRPSTEGVVKEEVREQHPTDLAYQLASRSPVQDGASDGGTGRSLNSLDSGVVMPGSPLEDLRRVKMESGERTDTGLVLCLLDGDADYFSLDYLRQGFSGGRKAAIAISTELRQHFASGEYRFRADTSVMLFWNLQGLAQFLHSTSGKRVDLQAFAQGFNSSPFACVAVDTGFSAQSADEAIKQHLGVFVKHTDFIVLGGSHDQGYSAVLHRLEPTSLREKVLLLRTSDYAAPAVLDLGLKEIRLSDGLFDGRGPCSNLKKMKQALAFAAAPGNPAATATRESAQKAGKASGAHESVSREHIVTTNPPKPSPPPFDASSPVNSEFRALVAILERELRRGFEQPLRSHIGGELKKKYPEIDKSFRDVADAAEKAGVVVQGKSSSKAGAEWIALKNPTVQLANRQSESVGDDRTSPSATRGATSTLATKPAVSSPTSVDIPAHFLPLVRILRHYRATRAWNRPSLSNIGEKLGLKVYEQAGASTLAQYCKFAERAGIVALGGPKNGMGWMELKEKYLA